MATKFNAVQNTQGDDYERERKDLAEDLGYLLARYWLANRCTLSQPDKTTVEAISVPEDDGD